MNEKQFWCVKCRNTVSIRENNKIGVEKFKNGAVALRSMCNKCGTNLTKFISKKDIAKMEKKYGYL